MLARNIASRSHKVILRRCQSTLATSSTASGNKWQRGWVIAGSLVAVTTIGSSHLASNNSDTEALVTIPLFGPAIGVNVGEDRIVEDTKDSSLIEEPETGITFPSVLDSKQLLGVGVRKKYQIFNVYALGMYANKEDFQGINGGQKEQEAALLDPQKPRTLKIIMNRKMTMEAVISALMDAVEPRMGGKDLWALDEFSKLRDYGALEIGDEIVLTIGGGFVECRCDTVGGTKTVMRSEVLSRAVCDLYFGKETISPAVKASAMTGISKL